MERFFESIEASHAESRATGIQWPEVDIRAIWGRVIADLAQQGLISDEDRDRVDPHSLAVQYEVRANPCWPMPNLRKCLTGLHDAGIELGIISNAQFYTPLLLESLLGSPIEKWGFAADLQYYSYQHGVAKPGEDLFSMAAETLRRHGFGPDEALYIGNDVLNDIMPARKVGFRTGLFAGDARSLRRRTGDPRVEGVEPDLVVTDLAQVLQCVIA